MAGEAGKLVGRGASSLAKNTLGMTTGAGAETFGTAYRAGKEGGTSFLDNMRGNVPMTDVLDSAKDALSKMRVDRGNQYRSGMVDIANDKSVINFAPIENAVNSLKTMGSFKGQVINKNAAGTVDEVSGLVNQWKNLDPAEYHTPEGLDALKQSVGAILEGLDPKTNSYNTVNQVYGAIKSEIVKQAPVYANVMRDYTRSLDQIREVERALSLGNKASADTAMRKLQSLMRDNVQTNYGQRVKLAKQLEEQGGQMMMPGIAGQALQSVVPRGMSQVTGTGLTGYLGFQGMLPQAAAAAVMSSPRLMGETAYGLGMAARPVAAAGSRAPFLLTPELYNLLIQSGQVQQLQE